ASSAQIAATFVADLTGLPRISVALTPLVVPSAYIEPQPLPFALPTAVQLAANRANWALGLAIIRRMLDGPVNRLRADYGLPPGRDWMYTGNLSSRYTAVAASPAFAPPPPDWPSFVHLTGFLFWDAPASWREPPELAAFLAGAQPVVA